jgi:toxin ParE1/3/4
VKPRRVIIGPDARADLVHLYDWLADAASLSVAIAYIDRIERHLQSFDLAPERGIARDDIRPGLRVVGFERRVTIAFRPTSEEVTILRVFYAGRNWQSDF